MRSIVGILLLSGAMSAGGPVVAGGQGLRVGVKASCSLAAGGASVSCSGASFDTESLDYGIVFGAGLGFPLGSGEALIDGHYEPGLAKVLDTAPSLSLNHRGLVILGGYSFRIAR